MKLRVLATSLALIMIFSTTAMAKGDTNGGDDFRQTAIEYDTKASKFRNKGYHDVARLYDRLAAIKRNAAKLADEGRWDDLDWTEYYKLEGKIEKLIKKKRGGH